MSRLATMLALPALLWVGAQGDAPQLEASLDLDRISVGEEVVYTLRAVSHSPVPLQVTVASLNGLEVVARSERSEVAVGGTPTRTTVLEIRLRAVRVGRLQVGPARAVQGRDTVEAAALELIVTASRAAIATTVNPRLRRLLDRASSPPRGDAAIDLLVSADTVVVGQQVDVVTAAWFPRDLRLQLRRPPTLQPPVIDGVWTYPQATPAGIAATRNISGQWYDLFVAHQVVFPLVPGTVGVPRATLKYSTPVALQFFSQEERFALTSRPETLVVRPLPEEGRPADFGGAIGAGLRLERRISPPSARVGEAVAVELALTGEGNTSMWPAPEARWPPPARAYVERVDEQVTATDGRLGGTKTFRYLVVSDSVGTIGFPAVSYPYFDLASGRYAAATIGPASIPVGRVGEPAATAALPPALLRGTGPALAWRAGHRVPEWGWLLLLVLPPLALSLRNRIRLPLRRRVRRRPPPGLGDAEAELERLIHELVPDPDRRSGARLAAAMRAAGADANLATRLAAARERLLARRYGPGTTAGKDKALAEEVRALARRLGGSLRGWRGRGAAALALMLAGLGGDSAAQAPPPERLYETGALAAAVQAFGARAAREPADAAHWYNLGASYYRLGERGRATAAWVQALRLSPRQGAVQRALRLTPPPDATSSRWIWSPPVTPEELLLAGAIGWLVGWVGWARRPRIRERWLALLLFAGLAVGAGLALRIWYRQPLAIVLDDTTLRLSPHGRAPPVGPLETGSAVRVERRVPGWVLVSASGGRQGWLADEAVAAIGG